MQATGQLTVLFDSDAGYELGRVRVIEDPNVGIVSLHPAEKKIVVSVDVTSPDPE